MLTLNVEKLESDWASIVPVLFVPHTQDEYEQLIEILYQLIDVVREDESHPLASLMDVIGTLIECYEDEHVPEITAL